ncbi:MAG: hypothetical protein QOD75_3963 [Blastocatellia bacterium]|jgi:hypothetical protein|nr:hypothetical protein [Blastocatellia bacterium]
MLRSIWAFITRVMRSHLGHVLLAVSWSFILFVCVRLPLNQPQFVDCVPTNDEVYSIVEILRVYPIWIIAIAIGHFPSMFLTGMVTRLLQRIFALSCSPSAKVEVPLFFIFSAIQWLIVGYVIESLVRRLRLFKRRT